MTTLTFIKIGDFYEIFGEDARLVAKELEITLTKDAKGIPLCGIPYHAIHGSIAKLEQSGYDVNVSD